MERQEGERGGLDFRMRRRKKRQNRMPPLTTENKGVVPAGFSSLPLYVRRVDRSERTPILNPDPRNLSREIASRHFVVVGE